MREQLISFETAKLAKEKGFDEPTATYYNGSKMLDMYGSYAASYSENYRNSSIKEKRCSAPTQSLFQKWLREKHDIIVLVTCKAGSSFDTEILKHKVYHTDGRFIRNSVNNFNNPTETTYEEALEQGLIEGLKLI